MFQAGAKTRALTIPSNSGPQRARERRQGSGSNGSKALLTGPLLTSMAWGLGTPAIEHLHAN